MKFYFLALATLVVVCVGCTQFGDGQHALKSTEYSAPPAAMMQRPGPGVDGPGPGVLPSYAQMPPPGAFSSRTTQVKFAGPLGMQIGWKIPQGYAEDQLLAPGKYNFVQGNTYRLKFSNVPGREGLTLYPTLRVAHEHPTTAGYLSHANVPIELTDEDLDQVESNNLVTKVIYLPDPRYQELAIAGVETLVSTRLDPGVDPVAEADRRGTIMAVLEVGNMDLEMPGPQGPGAAMHGGINQISHVVLDGSKGQLAPPMPIAGSRADTGFGVPGPMIMGAPGAPGQPAVNPVAGVGGVPPWGSPITGTPIGLPGPPHIPLGGPAGLRSYTVQNNTDYDVGKPVKDFRLQVKHEPGIKLPHPVTDVEYTESHPVFAEGEVAYPAWAQPAP